MTKSNEELRKILEKLCDRVLIGVTHGISPQIVKNNDIPQALSAITELVKGIVPKERKIDISLNFSKPDKKKDDAYLYGYDKGNNYCRTEMLEKLGVKND